MGKQMTDKLNFILVVAAFVFCVCCNIVSGKQDNFITPPTPDRASAQQAEPLPSPLNYGSLSTPEMHVFIRDIANIAGHRANPLTGKGLVTGLNGTGGKTPTTQRLMQNFDAQFGIIGTLPSSSVKSASVVNVNANLQAFYKVGETITAEVSVSDDATNIRGGVLQVTPLIGVDGETYAIASGVILSFGFGVGGDAGSVTKNHPTTGTVRAVVEKEICFDSTLRSSHIQFLLRNKDHVTATRIASAINEVFPRHARARDMGTVEVLVPQTFRDDQTEFIAMLGSLTVTPNLPARIVINQKNGTIVIGSNVKISRVIFANDNLIVTTNENPVVSQPNAFSRAQRHKDAKKNLFTFSLRLCVFAVKKRGASMSKELQIHQALENAEANIAYLATLSDNALTEKLDTVHQQMQLAERQKNSAAIELLETWRTQIIQARIHKAENKISDSPSEIELAIADIETYIDAAEERKEVFAEASQSVSPREKEQKQIPDEPEQLSLF